MSCVRFVRDELKEEFEDNRLDFTLKAITFTLSSYIFYHFGEVLWITSIYREGDTASVHGWWRGVDADNDNLKKEEKKEAEDYINKVYIYDPVRPSKKVCDVHTVVGRGGDHFHIQVHPNTTLRREKAKMNFMPRWIMRGIRIGLGQGLGAAGAYFTAIGPYGPVAGLVLNAASKAARDHFTKQKKDPPWWAKVF